jgi:pimeloyl-ACP methyl ester carboxylesterase
VTTVAFLPGAGGKRSFWRPVASRLDLAERAVLFAWPGFGDEPHDARIASLTDLVDYCARRLDGPTDVVAQSMGGVIALQLTLLHPHLVRRLVLCGTSGGIDLSRLGTEDWRPAYVSEYLPSLEHAPVWFVDDSTDVTNQLAKIAQPVLLLSGEADRISPPAVGKLLQSLLANARLVTVPGGSHSFAVDMPDVVAAEINAFLGPDT